MNDVLGQLGEIGEIEQEGSDHKVANIIFFFVIIITRPKRAGSCGQDTVRAGKFWGVLNVSLRAFGTQLGFLYYNVLFPYFVAFFTYFSLTFSYF